MAKKPKKGKLTRKQLETELKRLREQNARLRRRSSTKPTGGAERSTTSPKRKALPKAKRSSPRRSRTYPPSPRSRSRNTVGSASNSRNLSRGLRRNKLASRQLLLRLLKKRGRRKFNPTLKNEFVPLSGEVKAAWLRGDYRGAIRAVKRRSRGSGRVESIRLVIGGRVQKSALKPTETIWDAYFTHAFPEEALQYIDGFIVRVRIKKNEQYRDKFGRFAKRRPSGK